MSDEKKFITGLWVKERELKFGPINQLSIKVEAFIEWLRENENEAGYVNIDILKTKDGKPYAKLNDWKPGEQKVTEKKIDISGVADDFDLPF